MTSTDAILIVALGLAGFVFWRLSRLHADTAAPPPPPAGTGGTVWLQLGQNAVAPDRQWLLLQPGQ
jgi:hypothetical protein